MEDPTKNIQPQETENRFLSREEILALPPGELAEHLDLLEKQGRLEEYLREALQDDALVAQISYWEKWYTPEQQKLIDDIVHERFERESIGWELPLGLEKRYSEEELRLIFSNLLSIQPTFGCSRGCPLCGVDAVRKVRDQMPARLIENLFKKHGTELRRSESALYYASEPKNYLDPETGKKYPDLFAMAKEYADYEPYTTTANFSGNEWRAFLNAHPDRSRLSAWGITNPDRITEEIKVDDVDGIGEEQEKGFGVSRRNLGYHPEENDRFTGLNRLRAGMVLTPRGLYNILPIVSSDQFPQGSIVVPLENIEDNPGELDDNLTKSLAHCVVEIHREIDRKDWNLTENLARARYKKEFEYPPYSAILNTKSNPLLVFYDIDAQVKYVFDYDQEDLGWLIHANHSSNLFAWDYQGLTDQEFFDLKVHLMDERDPKVLAPTKKQQEGLIGWEFDMPKIGPVVIVLIKDKDENEQQRVIVRKKSDIGKMT